MTDEDLAAKAQRAAALFTFWAGQDDEILRARVAEVYETTPDQVVIDWESSEITVRTPEPPETISIELRAAVAVKSDLARALRDLLEVTEAQDAEWDTPEELERREAIHERARAALEFVAAVGARRMRTEQEITVLLSRARESEALGSRPDSATVVETLEWVLGDPNEPRFD